MSISKDNFGLVCLKGAGQVFFMENALTGALFFIAIAYASYDTGQWAITAGAVLGVVVATAMAKVLEADPDSYRSGLFGFNGILVGVALPTFIAVSPELWFYIIVGAAISTVVTSAFSATLTRSWGIPGSTGPFVLTAWLLLAGAYSFGSLHVVGETPKLATDYASGAAAIPGALEFGEIFFRNIGQVYLLGSWVSGVIILVGIFIASRPAGIAAIAGSLIALATAIMMRADPSVVSQGLYGFSPVLTAIAIGTVFLKPSGPVAAYAVLATIATVFLQAAFDVIMAPTGLPSYTAPYVLALYLFIAPRSRATPHPHKPVQAHFLIDDKS
ncbi:urea transporter [Devosia sp. 919]|uniref:urea transporter n=1 Tax=Devosia sp. 919 TaxID=2726065 RepID=UPI0015525F1B|nr:urea transporter [Devosia sp. 919]